MKRLIPIILLFPSLSWAACDCGSVDQANPCTGTSISVTAPKILGTNSLNGTYSYTFNSGGGDARCGQYASGDYWVAPASGQSTVTITAITSSTHPTRISADVDPVMESMGLLSATVTYGNYNADENIIPDLPLSYSGVNSIVTALERDQATEGNCTTTGMCAASYNVVTILPSVPVYAGRDSIRPNITGTSKIQLTWADFDLTRVPSKSYLVGTDTAGLQQIADRWRFNTEIFGLKTDVQEAGYSEGGRAFRASSMIDDYGGGMAASFAQNFMTISSDDNTIEQKKIALAAMISFGLDTYAGVFLPPSPRDRFWGQGATQSAGKFPPAAFFGALATSTTYSTNLAGESAHLSEYTELHGPHELGQIQYGPDGKPVWGDNKYGAFSTNEKSYWGALFKYQSYDGATGTPVSPSNREGYDPYEYIDGPPQNPNTVYAASSLGTQRSLAAMMSLIPEMCDVVNYPRLFTFVDRTNDYGKKTADDPCVTPDTRESISCAPYPSGENCTYYSVTWGPDPSNPGDCIKTPTAPYTQVGRFASQDGDAITWSYGSGQVDTNWSTIRAEAACGEQAQVGQSRGTFIIGQ